MILKIREGFWINLDKIKKFEWFKESKGHQGNCYCEHFELEYPNGDLEKINEQNAIEEIFKYLKSREAT